ncbi:hypothetical protein [Streptomyces sp. NPDC091879]|uniref:hypothetical protein n=1 Tax=Streptomyces sp. NPDC091879 TaxID=3366006 RepID=UPI00381627D8
MRTPRDNHLWKVRVLIHKDGTWTAKTFFYARQVFADRWLERARNNDSLHIDFYGKYTLEEDSVA